MNKSQKLWVEKNRERVRENDRKCISREHVKKARADYMKIWRKENKEKIKIYEMNLRKTDKYIARALFRAAVRSGKIKRLPCEVCGEPNTEGHHYKGYSKENALTVQWLCKFHHANLRRK